MRIGLHKIMWQNNMNALRGYKTPKIIYGRPSIIALNTLQRNLKVNQLEVIWVTDMTYIRTWPGWLYLTVVVDSFSRKVLGWSMQPTMTRD